MHLTIDRRPPRGASPARLPRAAAAALLTLLVASGLPVPHALAAGTATVSGTVTAPEGQPLPAETAVTVRVVGQPETTAPVASDGTYSVDVPADTTFYLAAGPTTTATLADSMVHRLTLPGEASRQQDLTLRMPALTGTVVEPDGAVVAGSLVRQRGVAGYEEATSKADGTWATAAPAGDYDLEAWPPTGSELRPSLWVRLTSPGTGAVLALRPPGNVVGSVSLPGGEPASGAYLHTQDLGTGQYLRDSSPGLGPDGKFALLLPAGAYRVTADPPYEARDLVSTSADVTVPESATTTVSITLERGNVLGTVERPDGTSYTGGGHVQVRDLNGQLLPGAALRNGTFAVKLAPGQQASLVVFPFGDSTVVDSESLPVTGPADGQPALTPTLALRTPNVTGVVRDLDGVAAPHSGVEVVTASGQHLQHVSADSSGTYALRLPAGEHVLRAQPNYNSPAEVVSGHQPVTVGDTAVRQDLTFRRANVLGKVFDPDGVAVSGAPVQVTDSDGMHVDAYAFSRADGSYGLLLADGTWTVTARAPHGDPNAWVAGSRSVTASATQVTGVDVRLQRPNVVGFVRSPSGAAVPNAPVSVQDANGYHVPNAWTSTGSTGKFGLLLPEGDYVLQAQPPYGASTLAAGTAPVTVSAGQVSVDVTLRQPNVAGEVRDVDGAVLRNSYVEVFDTTRSTYLQGSHAAAGRYSLFLQPGTYRLTARPPYGSSGLVATSITVTVEAGAQQLDQHISLKLPNLTGTVTNRDGTPAANAFVDVVDEQGQYVRGAYSVTGSDGQYALLLPSGTYAVTARPAWNDQQGQVPTTVRAVVVPAEGSVQQDVRLGTPNVTGTVRTPDGQPHRDAWIDVQDASGQHVRGVYAYTNAEGRFALALPEGSEYQLTARPAWSSTGLVAGKAAVTAAPDRSTDLTITLREPNVTGTVTAPDRTTVQGSYVDAVDKATGQHVPDGWAVSGPDGSFALALPAGQYVLTARPAWGTSSSSVPAQTEITVTDGATTDAPVQLGTANVIGVVTGEGTALPHLLVRATNETGDVAHTWTDRNGAYALGLPAGSYTLVVEPPYENPSGFARTSQALTVGTDPVRQDVALAKGTTTGVVRDSAGSPVANAFVHVYDGSGQARPDLGVATGADGAFTLALSDGPWSLQAQPSYALSESHGSSALTPVTAPQSAVVLTLTSASTR